MERPITPTQPVAIATVDRLLYEMARDQRLQARTLQAIGWKYTQFFSDKNEIIWADMLCLQNTNNSTETLWLTTNFNNKSG